MKKKILMIINPNAGRKKINKYIDIINSNFIHSDYDIDIKYTTKDYNAYHILLNYKYKYDFLVISGGDGTLNQSINALCQKNNRAEVIFIPSGTINDFSKTLGLSIKKYKKIEVPVLFEKKESDIGKFNDKYFNYVASFGIFSKTSYSTNHKLKNRFGKLSYIIKGFKEVFVYKTYPLEIESRELTTTGKFIYGSISNSKYIGGFNLFKYDENFSIDDGLFEVVLVKDPGSILKTIKLFFKITTGHLTNDDNIIFFRTSDIKINSVKNMEWSIDGEYSGKTKEITIFNTNKNITFLIPIC